MVDSATLPVVPGKKDSDPAVWLDRLASIFRQHSLLTFLCNRLSLLSSVGEFIIRRTLAADAKSTNKKVRKSPV